MITFNFDWIIVLQFVLATILPLIVGIVTTKVTAPNVKAVVLAALSLVASILAEITYALTAELPYNVGDGLIRFGAIFVVAVATHFGVWSRVNSEGVSISSRLQQNVGRIDNGN